jgi:hypothetical protein
MHLKLQKAGPFPAQGRNDPAIITQIRNFLTFANANIAVLPSKTTLQITEAEKEHWNQTG